MKLFFMSIIVVFLIVYNSFAQIQGAIYYRGELNGWSTNRMNYQLGYWRTTFAVSSNDNPSEFKFDDENADWTHNWGADNTSMSLNQRYVVNSNGNNGGVSVVAGKYYTFTFKDVADSSNSECAVMETSSAPVSITFVTNNVLDFDAISITQPVHVRIILSGAKSSEENIYVRYTSDNWSSDSFILASMSNTTIYTCSIPAQNTMCTVDYYAFTTTVTWASGNDLDVYPDLMTINYNNNAGANYHFTVNKVGNKIIDGDMSDWKVDSFSQINASIIQSNEWIWQDKIDDERTDPASPKNYDITKFKITADSNYIFFLFKLQDITSSDEPFIAISVDIDTNSLDSNMNWIGDDGNTTLGGNYDLSASLHYGEYNIIVHNPIAGITKIELFTNSGSWFAPQSPPYNTGAYISSTNNIIEVAIPRTNLNLMGNAIARFSIGSFDNVVGWANDGDTTGNYSTSDLLDTISIERMTTGTNLGGDFFNDDSYSASAWEEDISDGDLDFWFDVYFNQTGILTNSLPSSPSNPFPSDGATNIGIFNPIVHWSPASDNDGFITSYLIEMNNSTNFSGTILYRVNVASTNWQTPSLPDGVTIYWRVKARDNSGSLGPSQIWKFNTPYIPPPSPTVPVFTPIIDGQKEAQWGSTMSCVSTQSNVPVNYAPGFYLSNDAEYLYIGWVMKGDPWNEANYDKSAHYGWVFETHNDPAGLTYDPFLSSPTTAVNWALKSDFWLESWIKSSMTNFGASFLYKAVGGSWVSSSLTSKDIQSSQNWTELRLPLKTLDIQLGERLRVFNYFRPAEDKPGISDSAPFDDSVSAYADSNASPIMSQFSYIIRYGLQHIWHNPTNTDVVGFGPMRSPVFPTSSETVQISTAVNPDGAFDSGVIYYTTNNWTSTSIQSYKDEKKSGGFSYLFTQIPAFPKGTILQYVNAITRNGMTTYNYGNNSSSSVTSNFSIALSNAFSYVVSNSAPLPPTFVQITPELISSNTTITAIASNAFDIDNDSLTYFFDWYKNGVLQPALSSSDSTAPYTSIVDASNLSQTDLWYCKIKVSDGIKESPQVQSPTITVLFADWSSIKKTEKNQTIITNSELIWFDKQNDTRSINDDSNYDIEEIHLKADSQNLYILIHVRDMTSIDLPSIAMTLDTNRTAFNNATNIIGDNSDTFLGTNYLPYHRADINLLFHSITASTPDIEYLFSHSVWTQKNNDTIQFYPDSDVIEVVIPRTNLGLTKNKIARVSFASFRNVVGKAKDIDTTYNLEGSDAVDVMSIPALSDTNVYYNDNHGTLSAYDEELFDNHLDFCIDVVMNSNHIRTNAIPSPPSIVSPTNNENIFTLTPSLFWNASTDADGSVTSYLLELNDVSNFDGDVLYRVNVKTNFWKIPQYLPSGYTNYFWRVRSRDSTGVLSSGVIEKFKVKVQAPYANTPQDDRNVNNYGYYNGDEDADGTIYWYWPASSTNVIHYYIDIGTNPGSCDVASNVQLTNITVYTMVNLQAGNTYYAQIRAENNLGFIGPTSTPSDGIYVNKRKIDGNASDWVSGSFTTNNATLINNEGIWQDKKNDVRNGITNLDLIQLQTIADKYNVYFLFQFNHSKGFQDGSHFIQIAVDNGGESDNKAFIGRNVSSADLYVSADMPWEYTIKILSGLDTTSVCDQTYGNWQAGVYSENTNTGLIECAVPLSKIGGTSHWLNQTVKISVAVFSNDTGNVHPIDGDNSSDALDVVSDLSTTWNEISDRVINYSLSLSFDDTGNVVLFEGNSTSSIPNTYPISTSSWKWAQNAILYNMFVDRFENGNTANDPSDPARFGGDFQGLIKDMGYFRDLNVNTLYLSPVMEFGGGSTGYGVDYWWNVEDGFGGDAEFKNFLREARNNYFNVVIDWPGTAVGYCQPIRDEHPDWISVYKSPWGGWPEFTVGMAEVQQYLADLKRFWLAKGVRGFREDYAKFDGNPVDEGHQYWQQVEAKVAKTFPDFYNFGEVFDGAYKISSYVWSGQELKGCFDFPMKFSLLDWMSGNKDSGAFQGDVNSAESTYGNNPIMVSFIDNHDVDRVLRTMNWDSWKVRRGLGFTLTHSIPPTIFYGTETGMDGYRIGDDLDNSPCIDPMKWDFNYDQFGFIKHLIKGRRSFPGLRSDKGSRVWKYTSGQWLIYERNYYNDAILVIINQSSSSADAPTGSFTTWASRTWRDWMNWSDYFSTDASGKFGTITVPGNDIRVLVSREYGGGGFGTASLQGQTEPNAIIGVWNYAQDIVSRVAQADSSGNYIINDIVCKDSGSETFKVQVWAPGYEMKTITTVTLYDSTTTTLNVSLSIDVTPPSAPYGLSVKQGDKMVELNWDDPTEIDFDYYKIYKSTSSSGPFTLIDTALRSAYIDHNVDNGTTYYYKIRAKDRSGNLSGFSKILKVTPNPIEVTFWIDVKNSGASDIQKVYLSGNSEKMGFWGRLNPNLEMIDAGNDWWKVTVLLDPRLNIQYKFVIQDSDDNEIWENNFSGSYSYYNNRYFSLYNSGNGNLQLVHKWNQPGLATPRRPYGIVLSAKDKAVSIGWNNINTEPNLDHYTIYRSIDGNNFSVVANITRTLGKYFDIGLVNGTTYWYYLTVTDKYGNVSPNSVTNSIIPNTNDTVAPVAVSGISLSVLSTNSLQIRWNPNVEPDLAGYNIYRSCNSNSGYVQLNDGLISQSTNPYWIDNTVIYGTNYYYKVEAVDYSMNVSSMTEILSAYVVKVQFTVDMGNIQPSSVSIQGLSETRTMYQKDIYSFSYVTGLLAGQQYYYKYQYNTTIEDDFSTTSRYREITLPYQKSLEFNDDWEELPDTPQNVWAFPWDKKVDVYWDAVSSSVEDLKGYNIYWSTNLNEGKFYKFNSSPITDTKITVTGLSNGITYYFIVKSVDSGNIQLESKPSDIVSAIPQGSQPVFFKTELPLNKDRQYCFIPPLGVRKNEK